jgi:aminopeptidase N
MAGCREYFAKYKFQNTEFKDFIQCLQIGLSRLGSNYDLRLWALSWLTKAGVNEIHPVIQKDMDQHTFTLSLRQLTSKNGDPILHEQKLDVCLFDSQMKEHLIDNVRVKA